jgi:hypothetical protein
MRTEATGGKETMLIAEARVETERSSRYLAQPCRHFNHEAKAPEVRAQCRNGR